MACIWDDTICAGPVDCGNIRLEEHGEKVLACHLHYHRLDKVADLWESGEDIDDLLAMTWAELEAAWEALQE